MPGTDAMTLPPQRPASRGPLAAERAGGSSIPVQDWDLLLDAVKARLRTHTTAHQAVMLDCAAALELLHAALRSAGRPSD